jgi:maltose O-acetyltransferase
MASRPISWQKLVEVVRAELQGVHPRLHALHALEALLPRRNAGAARARLYARSGFRIGEGSELAGRPRITGPGHLFSNLTLGRDCFVGVDCVFDLEESITVGDSVTLSPGTMVLTSTHELGPKERRAGPVTRAPVTIGDGAWLGARAIVLPGLKVGAGAIVEAGAVVSRDVEPHTRVAGSPAAVVERLNPPTSEVKASAQQDPPAAERTAGAEKEPHVGAGG